MTTDRSFSIDFASGKSSGRIKNQRIKAISQGSSFRIIFFITGGTSFRIKTGYHTCPPDSTEKL